MRQFPVILIPPEVQRIAQSRPVAPDFNIALPSVPSYRQPKPIHIQEALFLTIGLVVVVALVTLIAKELGIILLIVGTISIIFRVRYQFQSYKRRYK
jgi:Flp pilus assembly protein TadB